MARDASRLAADRELSLSAVAQQDANERHNDRQIERACMALRELLRTSVVAGVSGAVGIRLPLQRGRYGNIRRIIETEE